MFNQLEKDRRVPTRRPMAQRLRVTTLADAPTPSYDEAYFSTFGTEERDFPMTVTLGGVDHVVGDEMELGKLRMGKALRRAIPKPVRKVVKHVTPFVPGAVVVSKTERRKLRKMVPKPIRGIAKRIAPIVVPGTLLFAPVRKTAMKQIRGVVKPIVGRPKPGVVPAPIDTTTRPREGVITKMPVSAGEPREPLGPWGMPGGSAGGGAAPSPEDAPSPEETPTPEAAAEAPPKGGLGPLLAIGAVVGGLYLWGQKG